MDSDDPLKGRTPEQVLDEFRHALTGIVQKAYYFGSFMTDSFGGNSDINLILVQDTETLFIDRPLAFDYLHAIADNIDILVYTQTELDRLTTHPSSVFWRNVANQMVRFL